MRKRFGLALGIFVLVAGSWIYRNKAGRVSPVALNGGQLAVSECQGKQLAIPFASKVPRKGMEWVYAVENQGFEDRRTFSRISYRFAEQQPDGERWLTHIIFGSDEAISTVFEVFAEDRVNMHPPRLMAYRVLEMAPFPAFKPGVTEFRNQIVLGVGWEPDVGLVVQRHYKISGGHQVIGPLGKFDDVWLVSGATPGWRGEFWWREDLGFIKMKYSSDEGQEVWLRLIAACQN